MYQTLSLDDFHGLFNQSHGYSRNFTHEGLNALFEYLEDLEYSLGETFEFDLVALCCEWAEFESPEEAVKQYDEGFLPDMGG